jgi:2-keto-4-pentenoate hydratase
MITQSLSAELTASIAEQLYVAERDVSPIAPLTTSWPKLSQDDAYAIAQVNAARKIAAGHSVVGRKVGLTSLAMQRQLGVDQPDYGVITDDMIVRAPATIDVAVLIAPRVEAEFAFRVSRDIVAATATPSFVRESIDEVYVAMEIIDSRIADWKIGLADTIADNASSARLVVGTGQPATAELLGSLPTALLQLNRNGVTVASGLGSEVLGDPLLGVMWVVARLGELGETIKAGEIILAGAVHASVPLESGVRWSVASAGFDTAEIETIRA